MDQLEKLKSYVEARRHLIFELVRIYLGLGLFAKGVYFVSNPNVVLQFMNADSLPSQILSVGLIGHYVGIAHLFGGLLLAAGLVTRLGAIVQLPVLIGAVFAVHMRAGFFGSDQNLEFSLLVLFLLVLTLIHGGGRFSADYYLARGATRPGEAKHQAPIHV